MAPETAIHRGRTKTSRTVPLAPSRQQNNPPPASGLINTGLEQLSPPHYVRWCGEGDADDVEENIVETCEASAANPGQSANGLCAIYGFEMDDLQEFTGGRGGHYDVTDAQKLTLPHCKQAVRANPPTSSFVQQELHTKQKTVQAKVKQLGSVSRQQGSVSRQEFTSPYVLSQAVGGVIDTDTSQRKDVLGGMRSALHAEQKKMFARCLCAPQISLVKKMTCCCQQAHECICTSTRACVPGTRHRCAQKKGEEKTNALEERRPACCTHFEPVCSTCCQCAGKDLLPTSRISAQRIEQGR